METSAFVLYLIALCAGPIFFGGVFTFAYTTVIIIILSATTLLVISDMKNNAGAVRIPKTPVNYLFIVTLAWLAFQCLPLPGFVVSFLSPEANEVAQMAIPASKVVAGEAQNSWSCLANYIYPARQSAVRLITCFLLFFGLIKTLHSKKRITIATLSIIFLAGLETVYGFAQTMGGGGRILWFEETRVAEHLHGTFWWFTYFAGYLGTCLALAICWLMAFSGGARLDFKKKSIIDPSNSEKISKRILLFMLCLIIAAGLVHTASRGGILSFIGGSAAMGILLAMGKLSRKKIILFFLPCMAAAFYFMANSDSYPIQRFKTINRTLETRMTFAKSMLEIWKDYKLTGSGMGSFRDVHDRYHPMKQNHRRLIGGYNDSVQFLAEGGAIGFILFFACLFHYIHSIFGLWKKRRDPFAVWMGAAFFFALIVFGIHSMCQYNTHIPANIMSLIAVAAIGDAALRLHGSGSKGFKLYARPYFSLDIGYKKTASAILIGGMIFWCGSVSLRHFMAEMHCPVEDKKYTLENKKLPGFFKASAKQAIMWDGAVSEYRFKAADDLTKSSGVLKNLGHYDFAKPVLFQTIRWLESAIELNPFQSKYHSKLGWRYYFLKKEPDYKEKWLKAADLSMERSAYFATHLISSEHISIGHYWIKRSKQMRRGTSSWNTAIKKARAHYEKAIKISKGGKRKNIEKFIKKIYPHSKYAFKKAMPFKRETATPPAEDFARPPG